jgi:hypothetical protein
LVKDFLAKKNVTTIEHHPYFTDPAPAEFYLFPRLQSALNGGRFCDAADIIMNAAEELKMSSQNGFQEYFQQFTVAGKIVYLHKGHNLKEMQLKRFLRNNVISGTFSSYHVHLSTQTDVERKL